MTHENSTNANLNVTMPKVLKTTWENISESLSAWQRAELERVDSERGVECLLKMWYTVQKHLVEGTFCNATWDTHYCWPPSPVGSITIRNCSETFSDSHPEHAANLKGSAFRVCQQNGTWLRGNWTNYSECADSYDEYVEQTAGEAELKERVRYIVFIGSILSLVFLLTAICTFCCFKSLWCDRVTIHIHLMAALTLRYVLLYVITEPFIFNRNTNYRDEDWLCKTVLILYLYATITSVNWMFIQGIYLNGKLTTNVFDKEAPLKVYYTFGWLVPVPLLAVYALVMERNHPVTCWKGYSEMKEIWIILGPILVALLINFSLLMNILRILMTKVHNAGQPPDAVQLQHFKRAAKATIVLAPILGINNLLFIYNPGGAYHKAYVILNSFFGSTQGVFVALVYCYLSSDVCSAVRRVYRRFVARRNANRCRLQQRRNTSCSTSSTLIVEQPVYHYRSRTTFPKCSPRISGTSSLQVSPSSSRGSNNTLQLRIQQRRANGQIVLSPVSPNRSPNYARNGSCLQQQHIPFASHSQGGSANGWRMRSSMATQDHGEVLIPLRDLVS